MGLEELLWLSESSGDRRSRRFRLTDIRTSEVSLVDRAANRRRFLVMKREDAMKTRQTTAANVDGAGTDEIRVGRGDKIDFGRDPSGLATQIRKAEAMPAAVKTALQRVLAEATERLMAVVNAVRQATTNNDKSPRPLPAPLGREIMAIGALLQTVLRKYPSPVAGGPDKDAPAKDAPAKDAPKPPTPPGKAADDKDEKDKKPPFLQKSDHAAVSEMLNAVSARIDALRDRLAKAEPPKDEDDEEEKKKAPPATPTGEQKAAPADDEDEEKKKPGDADKAKMPDGEDEEDEKSKTAKRAVCEEIRGIAMMLGGALAKSADGRAVAMVEVEVDPNLLSEAVAGLELHETTRKSLAAGLEEALDEVATALRDVDRMPEATSNEVPDGYTPPEFLVEGARTAGDRLLGIGLEHGIVGGQVPTSDLDRVLAEATAAVAAAAPKAPAPAPAPAPAAQAAPVAASAAPAPAPVAAVGVDVAKVIRDAIVGALAPFESRMVRMETEVRKNASEIKKSAAAAPSGNAVPPGASKPKSDGEVNLFVDPRQSPEKVAALKKDGLWF
jgi:hypothetical protein